MANDLGSARGVIILDTDFTGVDKGEEKLDQFGKKATATGKKVQDVEPILRQTSTGALVAGTTIAAGFAVALNAASNFEYQMSQIQAVSGATATEMEQISEAALRIGKDTSFSATEAGIAIEELVKAGVSVPDVLNGAADAVVALAAAGQIELPEAATIASAALNQFKLNAEDLVDVTDLMAGAANASATGVSEIGQALSFVGPTAQSAGVGIKDVATMIALFANNGIDGMRAGTALRSIISNLASPTQQAATAMQELGLMTEDGGNAFFDAQGNMRPMVEVTGLLRDAFSGLTAEQQLAYGETMFGREQLSALSAIVNTTSGEFDNLVAAIDSTSAADVAATRLDNMKGSTEQLMGSIETLSIQIGNILLPAMTSIIDGATEVVEWFINLDESTQQFMVTAAGITGTALLVLGALTKMGLALAGLRTNLLLAVGANTLFASTANGVSVASKIAAAAQTIWNAALNANPIVRIIGIILLLVGALITLAGGWDQVLATFEPVGQALMNVFESLMPAITLLAETIEGVLLAALEAIMPILETLVSAIMPVLMAVFEAIAPIIQVVAEILSAILAPVLALIAPLFEALVPLIEVLAAVLQPLIDLLMGALKPVLDLIVWALTALADGLTWVADQISSFFESSNGEVSAAQTVWEGFVSWLTEVWNGIVAFFDPVVTAIGQYFTDLYNSVVAVWTPIVTVFQTIFGAIGALFEWWFGIVAAVWNGIMAVVTPVVEWFMAYVWPLIQAVINLIAGVFNYLWSVITAVWDGIMSAIMTVVSWFMAYVWPVIEAFINLIVAIFNFLWNTLAAIWQAIFDVISKAVQGVVDFVSSVWGAMVGIIGGIWNSIFSFISGIVNNVVSFVRDIWNGLVGIVSGIFKNVYNSIKGPLEPVMSFFQGLYDDIVGFFSDAGSWLIEAGGNIIGGLIDGIEGALGWLTDTLNGITAMIPKEKGPPERDAVLLKKNGSLIMRSLIFGMKDEMGDLVNFLNGIGDTIPAEIDARLFGTKGQTNNTNSRTLIYQAAPGTGQLSGEDDLIQTMKRAKVVVPGW